MSGLIPEDDATYEARKLASFEKSLAVSKASQAKIDELKARRPALVAEEAMREQARVAGRNSWAGQLNLTNAAGEVEGFTGGAVNLAASISSGAGRVAGQVFSLPSSLMAMADESMVNQQEIEAYNRYKTMGELAGPETMAILNRKKALVSENDTPENILKAQQDADANPDSKSALQLLERGAQFRDTSRQINNFFDLTKTVNQSKRNELAKDLGKDFGDAWNEVKTGWDQAKDGSVVSGTGNVLAGAARLIFNAGEAAVTNPGAAAEYITENIPQLALGAFGKAGGAALATSNVGYAVDNYQQGIEAYQKNNDGKMPSVEQRKEMALQAASLAIVEQGSDMLSLGVAKIAGRSAADASTNGFKNTLKAAGAGAVTEGATEGYQTAIEGKLTKYEFDQETYQSKKVDASPLDIYTGATIGAVAGGGLSGGGRAIAEVGRAAPVVDANPELTKAKAEQFKEAAESGDTSVFLDPKTKLYDPSMAIGVLLQNANREGTTPEVRKERLAEASSIFEKMEADLAVAQQDVEMHSSEYVAKIKEQMQSKKAELDATDRTDVAAVKQLKEDIGDLQAIMTEANDTKGTKAAKAAVETLERQLRSGRTRMEALASVAEPAADSVEVESLIKQVQEQAPEQAAATDRIINLSMVQPDSLSAEQAISLANSTTNSLTDEQRTHLRAFGAARVLENQLSTMEKVSQEVLSGTTKNKGIAQWRAIISTALATNNEASATTALNSLDKFATSHAAKAKLATEVFNSGEEAQIIRNADGTWIVGAAGLLSPKELKENGGLDIHPVRSKNLVPAIGIEAQAIAATAAEMKSAIALKFKVQSVPQEKQDVPPGNSNDPINEEESPRLDVPSKPSTPEAPLPVPKEVKQTIPARTPKVVDHAKQKFASEPEAREYVRKNKLGATHRVFNSNRNEYVLRLKPESKTSPIPSTISPASPSSEPSGTVVADAPSATVPSSATAENKKGKLPYVGTQQDVQALNARLKKDGLASTAKLLTVAETVRINKIINTLTGKLKAAALNLRFLAQDGEHRGTMYQEEGLIGLNFSSNFVPRKWADGSVDIDKAAWLVVHELGHAVDSQNDYQSSRDWQSDPALLAEMQQIKTSSTKWVVSYPLRELAAATTEETKFLAAREFVAQLIAYEHANPTEFAAELPLNAAWLKQQSLLGYAEQTTQIEQAETGKVEVQERVSEANTSPAPETAPVEALVETTTNTDYKNKKLGDFFSLVSGDQNPLVSVRNFLSNLKRVSQFQEFISEKLTQDQVNTLKNFRALASEWAPKITANLFERGTPEYNYNDMMQFFIKDGDIDENVKTALIYAAYSYVAENAGRSKWNTKEQINKMLGRQAEDTVTSEEYALMKTVIGRQTLLINGLGKRAMQALGMQAKAGTPVNVTSQMQSALGAHAMRLLTDGKNSIMKRKPFDQDVVTEMMNRTDDNQEVEDNEEAPSKSNLGLKEIFLEFRRDEEGNLTSEALNIQNINRNSQSVVSKLFGIEDARVPPSLKPVGKVKEFVKRGKQRVPTALKKVLGNLNKQANFIRQEKVALIDALGRENFLTMMGKKELDPTAIHASNMEGVEANNDGLERELANIEEFINLTLLPLDKGMDQPFFFEHYSMSQQRVGITNKLVNPQLSKLQRFMIYRASWESTIDTTNEKQMANFWLRVAEGMGVKTEQFLSDVSIDKTQVTYNSKLVQDAIAAINAGLAGETLTSEQQKAVVDAVAKGGEKAHSLDALTALAAYAKSLEAGPSNGTFKVNMLAEVDGVTNGPMLSHLLLGAASSVADLYKMLNRGGFYAMGKGIKEFNAWRSQLDSKDLYQQTTANVLNLLRSQINARAVSVPLVSAVTYFLGDIASRDDKGDLTVKSAGRKMIKTPLTAVTYGSSLEKAVDESMVDDFIANIYAKIETISKMDQLQPNEAAAEFIKLKTNLEKMGVGLDEGMTIKDLMERSLSSAELKSLKQVFMDTYGQAVKKTIEQDFQALLETRTKFNRSMKNVWSLSNSVYNSMYEEYKAELIASGEMAVSGVGEAIHDLTPAQQATLNARLDKIMPSLQTAMSLQEAPNADTGLKVGKTELSMSTDLAYKNEVKFGKPYDDTVNSKDYKKPVQGIRTSGERVVTKDPGVGLGATSTHSFDSAVMHLSIEAQDEVLGLHDAKGVGAHQVQEAGRKLNKATWDQAMKYSPTQEAYNTFIRTLTGIDALINDPATPASVVTGLVARLNGMTNKKTPFGSVLMRMAIDMQALANQTDKVKFGAMATMETVAQYAVEGGAYEVTADDRLAAKAKLDSLVSTPAPEHVALINKIMDKLNEANKAKPAEKVTSEIAEVGTPTTKANIKIEAAMKAKPVMALGDVISMLKQNVTGEFNKTLLSALERSVAADITVRYVTAATPMADILEVGGDKSSGWYVSKDGKHEIYILSSEFKDSALTQEVLLHELLHGAVARIIEANEAQSAPFIAELNTLLTKAQAYVKQNNLQTKYGPAVSNVHELVSWGMTNAGFQKSVLNNITMASSTDASMFSTAFKAFVDTLVGLVFGRKNPNMANGMAVLISNTAGLLNYAEGKVTVATTNTINLAQTNTNNGLQDLTTLDIFEAISDTHNGAVVSPEFSVRLETLLTSIVDSLHGPIGAYKEAMMQQTAQSPEQVYQDAMNSGIAPFATDITQSGMPFTEQEAFVADQVQATVREATSGKDGLMSVAYRELSKLYDEVHSKMKVSDLYLTASPTSVEKAEAQTLYDFIFKIDIDADGKSEYLSRFAALGLANERFNTLLGNMTSTRTPNSAATGLNDRLFQIFNTILNWFGGKMTNTYNNQIVDAKLEALVKQIVKIEARKRATLAAKAKILQPAESMIDTLTDAGRKKLDTFLRQPFFRQNNNAFIRGGSALVSAYANDKVDAILDGVTRLRDKHFQGQNGMLIGLVNEFRGANDSNVMFHFLLRATKYIEGVRKDIITGTGKMVLSAFANNGEDLTKPQKDALTAVFLRADLSSLLTAGYNMNEIRDLINDPQKVFDEIARLEQNLTTPLRRFYVNSAKALGYYKAVGVVTADHLLMNAGNIARAYGTQQQNRVTEAQAKTMEAIIDPLVSLYALSYTRDSHMVNAKAVINTEAARTDGGNGVEMILKTHAMLQEQSKELLFDGSETLAMKGYTPDMFDPFLDVVIANDADGVDLIARGYSVLPDVLKPDDADATYEPRRIYYLRDGGLKSWNSGIFSTTGMTAKGSRVHNGNVSPLSAAGSYNANAMVKITADKQKGINAMLTSTTFNPVAVHESNKKFLAPVLNANGDVVNYRYLMTEEMKDNLLKRDNRTERVLGQLAGSIYDKVKSKDQNKRGVEALYEQYKEEFAERPEAYMEVGPKSTDPQLREIWRLLPAATKSDVRAVWGSDKMMVRRDLLDMNFGYRKLSIADGFDKDVAERSFVEGMFVEVMTHMFDRKAALRTRQAENIWQEVVKATKANLVVKSWSTMSGNLRSNFSQLLLMGVNPVAIGRSHRVAFKGAWAYKKDSEEMFSLKQQLSSGYLQPGQTVPEIEHRIKALQNSMNRNPVKPLIDAGLMPTIVEDIVADDDIYSYKSQFVKQTEKFTRHLNPNVVNVGKFILMTEDSTPYRVMSYATQISDFLARYTLYEHATTRSKNKLSHEAAVQLASDAFINYDVPTHRKVQYANDSGLVMFTKYYIRIQKMLVHIYKASPGKAIAMIMAEKMLIGDQPTVLDSSMITRWGNPMNLGALDYPGSLDALTTVRIITSPFSGGGNPAE